ncbi:MAG: hypothetical protein COB17_08085 [Sulfurimonas sp.]|nr:MAG: hypothetical protein COB17_08085 [Sulfurimonas sp.]
MGALVIDTGFIQTNTDLGALGGDILIDTKSIITKKSILPTVGGEKQKFVSSSGLNIIQAAAPQGNPGNLDIAAPKFELSDSLVKLTTGYTKIYDLVKDACYVRSNNHSSLLYY